MTKQDVDIILALVKEYVKNLLSGWGLSDTDKSLIAFEQKYMPYTEYSGKQSVDHVLFRKFLRRFNPDKIKEEISEEISEEIDQIYAIQLKTIIGEKSHEEEPSRS